jgi:hypothetical protein
LWGQFALPGYLSRFPDATLLADLSAGIKVSDAEMDAINIHCHQFHGDWNYTIRPSKPLAMR